jgi:uncharacterized YccA/Bax inhibitor family protein
MRTSNPVLRSETFDVPNYGQASMTLGGTIFKTGVLTGLTLITFLGSYVLAMSGVSVRLMAGVGGVLGLVFALITSFKPAWAMVTGSLYALVEGVALGAISYMFESRFPGIAISAAGCTIGTLAGLLLAYQSGLIRATENFRLGIFAATAGIMLFYLATFVLSFFGIRVPYIHESGLIGIGFSVFVVIIAALNLVLDFDFIERGVQSGAPKHMEWYAAFGLLVTLVWLYIEMLRLLAKIMGRRD